MNLLKRRRLHNIPRLHVVVLPHTAPQVEDESFSRLFLQVASWLALILVFCSLSVSFFHQYFHRLRGVDYVDNNNMYALPKRNSNSNNHDMYVFRPHYEFRPHTSATTTASGGTSFLYTSSSGSPTVFEMDAFGVASKFLNMRMKDVVDESTITTSMLEFRKQAERFRTEFVRQFTGGDVGGGGDETNNSDVPDEALNQARGLLYLAFFGDNSNINKGNSSSFIAHQQNLLFSLARRLLPPLLLNSTSSNAPTPLRILCLGDSAAAGVGNYRHQAYSFVLERLLKSVWPLLEVHHASIPDEEAWPFLWCTLSKLEFDEPPHVIVWDYYYSSTDMASKAKLEVFLRTIQTRWTTTSSSRSTSSEPPIVFFRNLHDTSLLQYYSDVPAILLNESAAAEPFLSLDARVRPPGFAEWSKKFGVASGNQLQQLQKNQKRSLMTVQQHEWIAWLLAMHLLAAMELSVAQQEIQIPQGNSNDHDHRLESFSFFDKTTTITTHRESIETSTTTKMSLPSPRYIPDDRPWSSILLGNHASSLQCYTSYNFGHYQADGNKLVLVPPTTTSTSDSSNTTGITRSSDESSADVMTMTTIRQHNINNSLEHLIAEGALSTAMEGILLPQLTLYNAGWVLDLDAAFKRAKQRTAPHFGGFEDWKLAYQGIFQSPPLVLNLPISTTTATPKVLWMCESSAPRGLDGDACSLLHDVSIRVNGIEVSVGAGGPAGSVEEVGIVSAFEKHPCIQVPIPSEAKSKLPIEVSLQVINPKVNLQKGPCSLAHVLYV